MIRKVDAVQRTCDRCGEWVDVITRAADDTTLVVNALPHQRGAWFRLNAGSDRGKYVKLNGDALTTARTEVGVILYVEHQEVCGHG